MVSCLDALGKIIISRSISNGACRRRETERATQIFGWSTPSEVAYRINQPISPSRISTRRTSWLGFGARHNLQSSPTSSVFVGNCPEFEIFTAGCAFPFPFQEKEGASTPIEFLFFIRVFLHSLDLELMGLEALPIVWSILLIEHAVWWLLQ